LSVALATLACHRHFLLAPNRELRLKSGSQSDSFIDDLAQTIAIGL